MDWLRRKWEGEKKKRGRERKNIRDPLNSESSITIIDDLETIFGRLSGPESSDWNKAIHIAKYGWRRKNINDQTPEERELAPNAEEFASLERERETIMSQKGMLPVILAVALAAFLQGHVQSSINAASLYADLLGVSEPAGDSGPASTELSPRDWEIGAMNASSFLVAALLGAPASLPTNYYIGRRGSLIVSAVLIIVSSIASAFARNWIELLGFRVIGGVGMGIKAVSGPILAAESVTGFWRGSIMITWQLWVACGIMAGWVINIVIALIAKSFDISEYDLNDGNDDQTGHRAMQFILGAPLVPSVALLVAVYFCYESPRFYMRPDSPNFNPPEALRILEKIRATKLQAKRDFIVIRWSTKLGNTDSQPVSETEKGLTYASHLRVVVRLSIEQYRTLWTSRRLRNAAWSTCTVALAQQLCGINVFAFYSSSIFNGGSFKLAMLYSLGFGLVNFVFCIPAMRTIDTRGRRTWLLATLPIMCLMLAGAAGSYPADDLRSGDEKIDPMSLPQTKAAIVFIFLFAAAYSPGLGPIPFTLASESFPLSHREAGASVAISVNLFFAGVLTIVLPAMRTGITTRGMLGFFSGMNIFAFVLVYLLVEETRWVNLEALDMVYDHPKKDFIKYQLSVRLPYFVKKYLLFQGGESTPRKYHEEVQQKVEQGA